eukprot:CAMPEP_0114258054 /NCGR_PEP_ID=MMETSP0058-20121206/19087_1 /TAXON_ID=36894 /ORGANISM="Pyramimonas parkeae, CCMP726" /LENGTH=83 /DNA_ID=CAMNT_0001372873 /DNA_START=265 /DNA_END=517 /DNA_ORIENTATION=-
MLFALPMMKGQQWKSELAVVKEEVVEQASWRGEDVNDRSRAMCIVCGEVWRKDFPVLFALSTMKGHEWKSELAVVEEVVEQAS